MVQVLLQLYTNPIIIFYTELPTQITWNKKQIKYLNVYLRVKP